MLVFRLSRRKYTQVLNGKGAAKYGNRWNSKGVEMIYSAESRALAMAEVVVHLTLASLPSDFVMVTFEIPDNLKIETINIEDLPIEWSSFPEPRSTQKIGNAFIESKTAAVLKVPSAVVKGDFNFLMNPSHPDWNRIKVVDVSDFIFDRRLFV